MFWINSISISILRESLKLKLPIQILLAALQFKAMNLNTFPARVRNNSATLIVNIFVNNPEQDKISGTLISDISDHFSRFCSVMSARENPKEIYKTKVSDYSRFSADRFNV